MQYSWEILFSLNLIGFQVKWLLDNDMKDRQWRNFQAINKMQIFKNKMQIFIMKISIKSYSNIYK